MTKLTITVDSSKIENFIINILNMFKNNPNIEFKKEGNHFTIKAQANDENLMLPGEPMSWEQLIADIELSEQQHSNGEFLTSKQLADEAKNW